MSYDTNRMVRALADSFEAVERPDPKDPNDWGRVRSYERALQAVGIIPTKVAKGESIVMELNVIAHAMGSLGGEAADNVRGYAMTLGASLRSLAA